jgi:hypothetical protein
MGASWSIAVLTPEYLVEGTLDSDWGSWMLQAGPQTVPNVRPVQLWNARLQSAGQLAIPAALTSHQLVMGDFSCLAVIPRDQASMDFVTNKNRCKTPIPGEVLVGPYVIRGSLWSPDGADNGVSFVSGYQAFVVQNAHIESLVPGAKLPSLDAPLAVVWTHLLYSAMVAQAPAADGKVGLDFQFDASGQPAAGQVANVVSELASGQMRTINSSASQLLATGTHGTAVITTAAPTGKTIHDVNPNADPSRWNDPMWLFTLQVTVPGENPFPAVVGHRVPLDKLTSVVPGVKLAVAVDMSNRNNKVAIDWDKSPLP